MSNILLETKDLTKTYGRRDVVSNVNIKVKRGSIYGLIGKNGAGKTTIMKMIAGMTKPTSGSYDYVDFEGGNKAAFAKIGTLIEIPAIMPSMSAYDNLKLKALAYGCYDDSSIREKLKLVSLDNTGKKKARAFSLGMKQRLGIALALIGDPEVLILDEPINGLDPEGIAEVRNTLARLNEEKGITIIISSHILAELAKLATDYAIIDNGRIIEESTREELELKSRGKLVIKCADSAKAMEVLKAAGYSKLEAADPRTINVYEEGEVGPDMNMKICNAGIMVYSFAFETADLEEYFLRTVSGADKEVV